MAKKPSFYLRFYGKTEKEVIAFLETLKKDHPLIQRYTIGPLTQTMNPIVPTDKETNYQAQVYFANDADMQAVYNNPACFASYQKFAPPRNLRKIATCHKRTPGDFAFGVS